MIYINMSMWPQLAGEYQPRGFFSLPFPLPLAMTRKHVPPSSSCRRASSWCISVSQLRVVALTSLCTALAGTVILPHAEAANDAWSTSPTSGTFTGNNWTVGQTTGGAPTGTIASGDTLYFDGSSVTTLSENEAAGFSLGGFIFNSDAAAYTISGNSFALGAGTAGTGIISNFSSSLETINDAITGTSGLTLGGGGAVTLGGALSYTGTTTTGAVTATYGNTQTLNLTGAGSSIGLINASLAAGTTSTINFNPSGTLTITSNILVGGGSTASAGVINQTGGTVAAGSNNLSLGDNIGAFGAYNMSGGSLTVGTIRAGGYNNGGGNSSGSGEFVQTGGTVTQGANNTFIGRAGAGNNLLYINGAGASFTNNAAQVLGIGYSGSSTDVVTLSLGTLSPGLVAFNDDNGYNNTNFTGTAILNLNGGTLSTGSITAYSASSTNIVNFNGGTLQPTGNSANFLPGYATGTTSVNLASANIYSGGAKINPNGFAITISQPLLTTSGTTGVTTIPVASGGSGYLAAPLVSITGGGGTGATAVANLTNGVVTSITITSPGTGYTSAPTVTLVGGGATASASLGTIATGSNGTTDGGLTVLGAGTLTLSGVNTFVGPTTVNTGTLVVAGTESASSPLVLNAGTLTYTPTTGGSTLTFNGTTIAGAVTSTINNTTAGNTLALGAITRNPGGLLSFGTGGTTTTSTGSNGLLGTYAFTGTGTGLSYVSSGTIAPYTAGTTAANATGVTDTTGTVNYNVGAGGAVGTGAAVNTLRYTGATDTISNPISLNGLMNAGTGTLTVSGAVTIGANNELVVLNDTQSTIISGPIANNGSNASALTYGGPSAGPLILSGTNTYTGATTIISGGSLQLGTGGTTGSLSPSSAITNNGNLTVNRSNAVTQGTDLGAAAITGTGSFTQAGTGTTTLNAANTYTGLTTVSAGALTIAGTGASFGPYGTTSTAIPTPAIDVALGSGQTSTLNLSPTGSVTVLGDILVGGGSSASSGVVNQTNGTVNIGTTAGAVGQIDLGNAAGAYGAYNMSGGTLNVATFRSGGYDGGLNDSTGNTYFNQTGGVVNNTVNVNSGTFLGRDGTGTNVLYIGGVNGSTPVYNSNGNFALGYSGGSSTTPQNDSVTIATGGTLNAGIFNTLTLAHSAYENAVLNLDGGLLSFNSLNTGGTGSTFTSIFNFNGGTLQAISSSPIFMTGLTSANVYAGGANINTNGQTITIAQPLLTTANTVGVTAPAVTNGGAGYIGAPVVTISGGGGTGATAIATINSNGVVTGITITNPGTGYTSAPTVTLAGGGGTGATLGTVATASNGTTDGGLTVLGGGTLTLTGASTYNGGTTVSAGTLNLADTINNGTPTVIGTITVNSGATLLLSQNNVLGYNAGSTGSVSTINVNGGTVTNAANSGIVGQGYLTNFVLTGGTVNATAATPGAISFNTGYGITSNASATTSLWSAPITTRGTGFTITTNPGTTASGIDLNISGAIGTSGGNGAIVKAGTGVLQLTAANTYTGTTTVNAGTLSVGSGGTLGSGAITVNNGGTLLTSGTGTLGSGTMVTVAGTGALTLGNSVSFNSAQTLTFASTSTVNLGTGTDNTLSQITEQNSSYVLSPGTYTAAQLDMDFENSTTGTFTGAGELTVVVPEPATWIYGFLMVGVLGVSQRRKIKSCLQPSRG